MFKDILKAIKEHNTVIIHRHSKPDGDAIGSQVGLKHLILDNFPEKRVLCVGDPAGNYSFVADSVMDEIGDWEYKDALAIVLDCGSPHLISDDRWQTAKATARFDHHLFTGQICELEAIDTGFESCCGLLTQFALDCGLTFSKESATALFTGMVTDSGRFRYDSARSRTFALASKLMEQDIDTNELYRNLYADDFEGKKLRAYFTLKIGFTENNVAYIYTDADEVQRLGVDTFTVSRGMVGTMADTKGVDIWVNFTETDKGILCELRSSKYNINPIAVKYGGGGHEKASGATVCDCETAMAMLKDLDEMAGKGNE